jgi:hypothetical protein
VTDEWTPLAPVVTPAAVPIVSPGFGLSGGQQFQFTPPVSTLCLYHLRSYATRQLHSELAHIRLMETDDGRSTIHVVDESPSRSRVPSGTIPAIPSNTLSVMDKTKPPMISLPHPLGLHLLIQRATTPLGSILITQSGKGTFGRQHGASMPPSQSGIQQLPSTNSLRSAANAVTYNSASSHANLPYLTCIGSISSRITSLASKDFKRHICPDPTVVNCWRG